MSYSVSTVHITLMLDVEVRAIRQRLARFMRPSTTVQQKIGLLPKMNVSKQDMQQVRSLAPTKCTFEWDRSENLLSAHFF